MEGNRESFIITVKYYKPEILLILGLHLSHLIFKALIKKYDFVHDRSYDFVIILPDW